MKGSVSFIKTVLFLFCLLFALLNGVSQKSETTLIFQSPDIIQPDQVISSPNSEYFVLTDKIYAGHLSYAVFQVKNHTLIASGIISLPIEGQCFSIEVIGLSNDGKQMVAEKECKVFLEDRQYFVYDIEPDSLINDIEIDWSQSDDMDGYFKLNYDFDFSSAFEISELKTKYVLEFNKKIYLKAEDTDEEVWQSPKQKSSIYENRSPVYLENSVVVLSAKTSKDKNEQFIWYDFLKEDTIFSTKNPFGGLDYNSYLIENKLVLPLKKYPFKYAEFQVEIDLSNGHYHAFNYGSMNENNGNLQHSARAIIVDSTKANSPYFVDTHQSLWHIFRKYYNRDGTLKVDSIPGRINREFYPATFWNRNELADSLAYNWYVFSAFNNKVIYMDVKSASLFNTSLRQEMNLQFWNGNKINPAERNINLMYVVDGGPFFYADDLYYMTNSDLQGIVNVKYKGKIYPYKQFDLKYNRPDIILDRLGYADQVLIDAYHSAYLKRLKKMGFTEDMLQDDFHLPEIQIENLEALPTLQDQGSVDLKLKLEDSKYKLDRINVWVNDVAIYGADGISLRDKNTQTYTTTLSVNLTKGQNKVQVSVLNKAGAESYKETINMECTAGKKTPDLYIITIGASVFEQANYNLTYAAKDAKDIATLFLKSKAYDSVFTKSLINEQVTKANVLALKSFFEKADINDQVMIFIAGHGVLDLNYDYFLATYNMDFVNPKEKGLAYEDLEDLLDGIKPLKKTLLIDACHSGEVDKDEIELASNVDAEHGEIRFRAVGNAVQQKLGMQNTSEFTTSLFSDLRKGTGATVISSAGGMEFAMEGAEWKNGLYTFCLLNGIESNQADLNKDGEIWLSELQKYVSEQVTELSGGKQQPTARIENQSVDFRVW
ncbi:caspase family protein [Putridiphycobacter roseus]|nr:caspase family protein [Putridiphycobacter roseus]